MFEKSLRRKLEVPKFRKQEFISQCPIFKCYYNKIYSKHVMYISLYNII
jgi:hypothetical protein